MSISLCGSFALRYAVPWDGDHAPRDCNVPARTLGITTACPSFGRPRGDSMMVTSRRRPPYTTGVQQQFAP